MLVQQCGAMLQLCADGMGNVSSYVSGIIATVTSNSLRDPGCMALAAFDIVSIHKGTWGGFPGGGQTEKLYTNEKQEPHPGRPCQSAYRGWSVPTKECGYYEVNLSPVRVVTSGVFAFQHRLKQHHLRWRVRRVVSNGHVDEALKLWHVWPS